MKKYMALIALASFLNSYAEQQEHAHITVHNKTGAVATVTIEQQKNGEISEITQTQIMPNGSADKIINLALGELSNAYVVVEDSKCKDTGYFTLELQGAQSESVIYELSNVGKANSCKYKLRRLAK